MTFLESSHLLVNDIYACSDKGFFRLLHIMNHLHGKKHRRTICRLVCDLLRRFHVTVERMIHPLLSDGFSPLVGVRFVELAKLFPVLISTTVMQADKGERTIVSAEDHCILALVVLIEWAVI